MRHPPGVARGGRRATRRAPRLSRPRSATRQRVRRGDRPRRRGSGRRAPRRRRSEPGPPARSRGGSFRFPPRPRSRPGHHRGWAPACASTSAASAWSRPTSGSSGGAPAAVLARAGAAGGACASCGGARLPSFTCSYRVAVSSSGATPSSWLSVRTQLRYCSSAAARSPLQAYSRISSRWAGSCRGSTSSHAAGMRDGALVFTTSSQQLHQAPQR